MATAISTLQDMATRDVHAMDSPSGGSSSDTSINVAAITSNDFLTLLVAEMKNQDPTATMDPNEYINQLVNVNSLQQLMSINQTLEGALGTSSTDPATSSESSSVTSPANHSKQADALSTTSAAEHANAAPHAISTVTPSPVTQAVGNFTIPAANPNAKALAHAFMGHRTSK